MLENIMSLVKDNRSENAWSSYKNIVMEFSKGKSVLEIGAGRRPIFTAEEIEENNIKYVANDIMADELSRIPFPVEKAVFDVSGEVPEEFTNKFDFVFSKMVQEHVRDGRKFYTNIYKILNKSGMSLNFYPTMFHPVFVVNYLLPDSLSAAILRAYYPHRNDQEIPKFPAYYHFCRSTKGQAERIRECGFREAYIIPFYGQGYLKTIPILSAVSRAADNWFMKENMIIFSAFAYSVSRK